MDDANQGGDESARPVRIRVCAVCEAEIEVGRGKVGRVVFPGGVCYECYKRTRGDKLK